MATYFHGGSGEIQTQGGENLQTLYLMNPNYFTTTPPPSYNDQSNNHHNNHHLLLNAAATTTTLMPQHQQHHQQLIGIPLSSPHHHHYNNNLWSPTSSGQAQPGPAVHDLGGQVGFRSPPAPSPATAHPQGGLSLSLTPGQQQQHRHQLNLQRGGEEDMRMSVTVASGPGSGTGSVIGSKYLRATQELLEEVVNVGGIIIGGSESGESSGVHKGGNKAKTAVKDDDVVGGSGGGDNNKKVVELSTSQRQELQMKKAKLLNMLDEVEQRYRQYHTQMQVVISSFEQATGIGSAKSYTSLALKTISKQFRCLKDAISSQIKATSKSLGEDDNNGGGVKLEGGAGSRLRFVDHQLRQQRALQQLGMMQNNAWRPQRGLPERAVSVLRAWLFEHFLHPYPKDSDKHMLAKQTGLTRSQVSNWFINARVRLWKPMVEEMYVEEMKNQEQKAGTTSEDNTNTTATTTNNTGGIGTSSSKIEHNQDHSTTNKTTINPQQHEQHDQQQQEIGPFNMIQTHQNDHNHQTTNDMISGLSSSQGFTLIGSSSDMESLMTRSNLKKQRSNSDLDNSPNSILSMDMEMKPIDHQQHQKYAQDQHQRHSMMSSHSSQVGFNPYIVNNDDIGRFNPDQITASYHGNAVSLTLGLPHGHENLSMSETHQQQNFFPNHGMQLGRRLDVGPSEGDYCGISMGQNSHTSNVYESIDIQSRKRFAAHQILHDFVA